MCASERAPRSQEEEEGDTSELRSFASHFARIAATLPQVRKVLLVPVSGRVWVLIDTDPDDPSQRWPVYAAQLATRDAFPESPADFAVVNLPEFADVSLEAVLPAAAEAIWTRDEAA